MISSTNEDITFIETRNLSMQYSTPSTRIYHNALQKTILTLKLDFKIAEIFKMNKYLF